MIEWSDRIEHIRRCSSLHLYLDTGSSTEILSDLCSEFILLMSKDQVGTELNMEFEVEENSDPLIINDMFSDFVCGSASNGFITTNLQGGVPDFTYLWSTGDTTSNLQDLSAGNYDLTVTDGQVVP